MNGYDRLMQATRRATGVHMVKKDRIAGVPDSTEAVHSVTLSFGNQEDTLAFQQAVVSAVKGVGRIGDSGNET